MNLKNVQEIEKNKIELTVVIDRAAFEAAVADVFKKNVQEWHHNCSFAYFGSVILVSLTGNFKQPRHSWIGIDGR